MQKSHFVYIMNLFCKFTQIIIRFFSSKFRVKFVAKISKNMLFFINNSMNIHRIYAIIIF